MIARILSLRGGIRARVFILAVAPLIAMTLLIGGYAVRTLLGEARLALDERGRIVATNLAMAGEFGLLTRNSDLLQRVCDAQLRQPDVELAAILDAENNVLVRSGVGTLQVAKGQIGRFRAPIHGTEVTLSDFQNEFQTGVTAMPEEPPLMGWAIVRLSLEKSLRRQRRITLASLTLMGGGLLISALIAMRIGHGISRPMVDLSAAMTRYRQGDLTARVQVEADGEMADLQLGFNRMAQALERSQGQLQSQVETATHELQATIQALSTKNEQLESAREEALEAAREKYEFLARMSHEIRTPLNAVIGFSRLLNDEPSGRDKREFLQTIDRAANQLLYVIDGVLNFTKIESGSVELEKIPFDLRACIEDVVAMLGPVAHEKGLELALLLHQDIPHSIVGDPNRTSQVLLNLVNNAVKFTPEGYVFVEAGYAEEEADRGVVRISVTDTGIGITAAEQERLFQPFIQADSSVTRRFGGTGLGLVIIKRLVDLMGGRIEVESKPQAGSRFYFTIPCDKPSEGLPAGEPMLLGNRKILVYDAQPIQLQVLRETLASWGMDIQSTAHREQIPSMLDSTCGDERPFELVLLGLGAEERQEEKLLPLIGEIRERFSGAILLLVGTQRWGISARLTHERRLGWTSKPFRRETLYRKLCNLVGCAVRPEKERAEPEQTDHLLRGMRVLVVEDNSFNRMLMRRLLEKWGVVVSDAEDGAAAIELIKRASYDLVFMDIHMPGMDGIDTTRRIRANRGKSNHPPILALSADVFARDQIADHTSVFDDFLVKPVAADRLKAALLKWARKAGDVPEATKGSTGSRRLSTESHPMLWPQSGTVKIPGALLPALEADIERLCDALERAVEREERARLAELAHELKGVCDYFGLEPLTRLAVAIEDAATTAPRDGLLSQIHAFRIQAQSS